MFRVQDLWIQHRTKVYSRLTFVLGCLIGFLLAIYVPSSFDSAKSSVLVSSQTSIQRTANETHAIDLGKIQLDTNLVYKLLRETEEKNARMLSQTVRVLCWVMTTAGNHQKKAIHVKRTWGAHCNTLLFISDAEGYVLSKEAIHRLMTQAFDGKHQDCPLTNNTHSEDVNMGKCLHALDIYPDDSRDALGRYRFLPLNILNFLGPQFQINSPWFWEYIYWPVEGDSLAHVSFKPVSFHYTDPETMYKMEFLTYYAQPCLVLNLQQVDYSEHRTTNKN